MNAVETILGLGGGLVGLAIFVLAIVAIVLWFFLPFAVFGVKEKLNRMIATAERTNELLTYLANR